MKAGKVPSKQNIIDASDLRKWRTELPNLYDDLGLDPYEFRLLAHYKRVGNCVENVETTAEKCAMSVGKVSQVRQSLAKKWKLISLVRNKFGGFNVKVKDIWEQNFAHYSAKKKAYDKKKGASPHEGVHQVMKGFTTRKRGSPHGEGVHVVKQRNNNSKKQPDKKEPDKKQQQDAASVSPAGAAEKIALLDQLGIEEPTRTEIAGMNLALPYLEAWVKYKERSDARVTEEQKRLGPGFFVKRLRQHDTPPAVREARRKWWNDEYDKFVNR